MREALIRVSFFIICILSLSAGYLLLNEDCCQGLLVQSR